MIKKTCILVSTGARSTIYAGKRLRGDLKENYSFRVGKKLRIIYIVSEKDKTVYVVAIGPGKKRLLLKGSVESLLVF